MQQHGTNSSSWPQASVTPVSDNDELGTGQITMTDNGTGTVQPAEGHLVFVPKGHGYSIFPITDVATDDGSAIIDHAEALHHVHELLENGEDG